MLATALSALVLFQSCWGPAAAVAVATPVVRQIAPAPYEWVPSEVGSGQLHLFRGPKQVGSFVAGRFHPLVNGRHQADAPLPVGAPLPPRSAVTVATDCDCCTDCECSKDDKGLCPCPSGKICNTSCRCVLFDQLERLDALWNPAPAGPKVIGQTEPTNFGLDVEKWKAERLAIARGFSPPPDDAGKCRITVIGTDAERKAVIDDIGRNPALAAAAGKCVVNAYPPDHWAVTSAGFKALGHPTIYYQSAAGKVLHRQDDYDGPARLAEAIRRADPAYDPAKDPDRRADPAPVPLPPQPPAPALPDWLRPENWPGWVWAVVGVAGIGLLRALAARLGGAPGWLLDLLANRLERRLQPKDEPPQAKQPAPSKPRQPEDWNL